jgi:hypothetical protein
LYSARSDAGSAARTPSGSAGSWVGIEPHEPAAAPDELVELAVLDAPPVLDELVALDEAALEELDEPDEQAARPRPAARARAAMPPGCTALIMSPSTLF